MVRDGDEAVTIDFWKKVTICISVIEQFNLHVLEEGVPLKHLMEQNMKVTLCLGNIKVDYNRLFHKIKRFVASLTDDTNAV